MGFVCMVCGRENLYEMEDNKCFYCGADINLKPHGHILEEMLPIADSSIPNGTVYADAPTGISYVWTGDGWDKIDSFYDSYYSVGSMVAKQDNIRNRQGPDGAQGPNGVQGIDNYDLLTMKEWAELSASTIRNQLRIKGFK
jgi:hypothetical protein